MANSLFGSVLSGATTGAQQSQQATSPVTVTTSSVRKQTAQNQSKLQQLNNSLAQSALAGANAGAAASSVPSVYTSAVQGAQNGLTAGVYYPLASAAAQGAQSGLEASQYNNSSPPPVPSYYNNNSYNSGSGNNQSQTNLGNNQGEGQGQTATPDSSPTPPSPGETNYNVENLFNNQAVPQPSVQPSQPSNLPPLPQAPDYTEQFKALDAQLAEYKGLLDAQKASSDDATRALIDSIQQSYDRRRAQLEDINRRYLAGLTTANLAGGLSRYSTQISDQILSNEERAGIQKLADLDAEEKKEIASANLANQEKNFQLLNLRLEKIDGIRKEKTQLIQQQFDNALTVEKANREREEAERARVREERESAKFKLEQAQKLAENVAPNILEVIRKNPGQDYSALITQYANQYGVDPIALSGNVLKYRTEYEKDQILKDKANLDLLSSKINLLKESGATGKVNIPGVGEVEIKKKGDYSTVDAGGQLYVFDKDSGTLKSTGLKTDQLDQKAILGAVESLAKETGNTDVLGTYLQGKGVPVSNGTVQIPKSSYLASVNNNPGNLKFVGQPGAVKGQGGFAKFATPEDGYVALLNQIKLDASRGLTLSQFINKYAPPSENDTNLYIKQVSQMTGASPDTKISQISLDALGRAVARKESSTVIGESKSSTSGNNISQYGRSKDDKYLTAANKLSDDYRAESKDFVTQRNAYQNAKSVNVNTSNPQDDISLIYSFMKVVDPTSVVRETEFNTAAKASSFLDQFNIRVGKVTSGQILNPKVRKDIIDTLTARYQNAERNQKQIIDTYSERARQQRIDPNDVITNYSSTVQDYQSKLKKGEILVRDAQGRIGAIPVNEFNPKLYTKV